MTPWLQRLSQHAIFTLPPSDGSGEQSGSSKARSHEPALSELAPPSDPHSTLPAIFGDKKAKRGGLGWGARSLSGNSNSTSTSIGGRKKAGGRSSSVNVESHDDEQQQQGYRGRTSRLCIVRGTDLILAVGRELRIAGLVDVKAKAEEPPADYDESISPTIGEYKTLRTPLVDFEIKQLVLNPTSKLLAVIGVHSVAVVVLPRKGWVNSVGRTLDCRSYIIGKFYHSLRASPSVAQALWHPWGENSTSLLVLTSDCCLREYNIGDDTEEPAQTISLSEDSLLSSNAGGRSRDTGGYGYSDLDSDASYAVACCLGEGKGDWGPLTVYALMKNGDIRAACPFLPKKATLPSSYIHALSCFVSAKVDFLNTASTLQEESSRALVTSIDHSSSKGSLGHHGETIGSRYNLQLKYVNALVRQLTSDPSAWHSQVGNSIGADDTMDLDPSTLDQLVTISAPSFSNLGKPSVQGPFLMQPAPAELDNGAESYATDLAYVNYQPASHGEQLFEDTEGGSAGMGIILVVFSDGKVDICLEVEKIEARWGSASGGSYNQADESDLELPALAVYESIDLGLAASLNPGSDIEATLSSNYPVFAKDPLYPDTLYVYHILGSHCLLLSKWAELLSKLTLFGDQEEDVSRLQREAEDELKAAKSTEVVWILQTLPIDASLPKISVLPVVGSVILNDVYLGYSLLLVTSALQLVGIELSLRVDAALLPSFGGEILSSTTAAKGVPLNPTPYVSLLDAPFTVPAALDRRSAASSVPRLATMSSTLSANPGASVKKELTVTPESLRFLGKTVEAFRYDIRDLVSGVDVVQNRLELQMKELSRQLSKLEDLSMTCNSLKQGSSSADGLVDRLATISANQDALLDRTDRVLQRLMDAHAPVLSSYEKKWFEELGRLEKEIKADKGGDRSLERRAERVIAQIDSMTPAMEALNAKGADSEGVKSSGSLKSPAGSLGKGQTEHLEARLSEESRLIGEAKKRLEILTEALANSTVSAR